MDHTCVTIEGGLLGPDFLETIADAEGQKPSDFGLPRNRTLVDEVTAIWSDVRSYWDAFQRRRERSKDESLTSVTREQWMRPLLEALGYEVEFHQPAATIDGRSYNISHRTGETEEDLPVHIVAFDQDLGSRPSSGRGTLSPHAMVQDYLNRSEHLWAVVTNGSTLRLLRDSSYFTRPSYIEFDLKQMLEGERLDEFFILYRLVHRSRLPVRDEDGPECLLEQYHQLGIEQGGRIRDGLRVAVQDAIVIFANGFLDHPGNEKLREAVRSGEVTPDKLYQELLYLIYRLLFLMVAEERGLLTSPPGPLSTCGRKRPPGEGESRGSETGVRVYFTIRRLREMSEQPLSSPQRFEDLYLNLRALFFALYKEKYAATLCLPPLNGELFEEARTPHLGVARLDNRWLLSAIRTLSRFVPKDEKVERWVNYGGLDVEELGSVYESLLDLQPQIDTGTSLHFGFVTGTERKTTGSYYTRPELVQELIKSALVPVIEDRLTSPPGPLSTRGEGEKATARPEVAEVPGYVYELCRELRKQGTDSEGILWEALRDRRLAGRKFRRQHPLGRYIADFYCAEEKLVVEVDGGIHLDKRQAEHDAFREEELKKRGLDVVRVTADQVENDLESALSTILNTVTSPSPRVERGPGGEVPRVERGSGGEVGEVDPREAALLSLTVCDPACGSGHFLLAAARRIGHELAKVRTGEEAPAPDAVRAAVRDAITHCIYGVDKNPLAVDLCKVALWIEGHSGGKPLTFLDHRIRCGDSLVGVFDLSVLREGIPDDAFKPVTGDDKAVAKAFRARNKEERTSKQTGMVMDVTEEIGELAEARRGLAALSDDTPDDVHRKHDAFDALQKKGGKLWDDRVACDLWTAAFFADLTPEARDKGVVPTTATVRQYVKQPGAANQQLVGHVRAMAEHNRFFHWPLEFPEVFEQGGFDCVLSNPPWERVKLQEKEFFATRAAEIAEAPNKAARQRLIEALADTDPGLLEAFRSELHTSEATSDFIRRSERYPLTGCGDVNTYAIFTELSRHLTGPLGRSGLIVPTGIATDSTTQDYFEDLMVRSALASLVGFENEAFIFQGVHNEMKFCALTQVGSSASVMSADLVFFCRYFHQTQQSERHFRLSRSDLDLLNPNTRTCPIFRTTADAELTKRIYSLVPVLVNETTGGDHWGVRFLAMFHMANDSGLFRGGKDLQADGAEMLGNTYAVGERAWVPLYESKIVWHYDHRFASLLEDRDVAHGPSRKFVGWYGCAVEDPADLPTPRYWVGGDEVEERLRDRSRDWLLGFRDVTNATNERTVVFSVIPRTAVGHSMPVVFFRPEVSPTVEAAFIASVASLCLDYAARQKVAGMHLTYSYLKQLPILPPETYAPADLLFIVPRVVELTYTAWDIKAFADDVWREADLTPQPPLHEWRGGAEGGGEVPSAPSANGKGESSDSETGVRLRQAIERQWEANRAATGGHEWDPPEWAEIADDGCPLPPFKWDEDRRAVLRAELDAYYARLYGLNRKQLRYILDPHGLSERELEDILDPWEDPTCSGPHLLPSEPAVDFPGETFRVLKNKEEKQFGEYRTRRLVLEAWERLELAEM